MGFWVVSEESLMEMLHRAYSGENPGVIVTEEYANCRHDHVDGG